MNYIMPTLMVFHFAELGAALRLHPEERAEVLTKMEVHCQKR